MAKTKTKKSSNNDIDENVNNLSFNDEDVDALDPLEAIRKRYDMYIGSGSEANIQLINEAVDNIIDEHMNGFGNTAWISIDTDSNMITIEDEGRGLPLGTNAKLKKPTMEVLLTHVHSGSKYDKKSVKTSGGKNGVGIKCITACSTYLKVTSKRKNEAGKYERGTISFSKGKITEPFKKVTLKSAKHSGTKFEFIPDFELLENEPKLDIDGIRKRLDEKCYLNENLTIHFTVDDKEEIFRHKNGILDLLNKELKNPLYNMEPISFKCKDGDNTYKVTLGYNNSTDEVIRSFVNCIGTDSGTHETGFKTGLTRAFNDYISNNGLLSKKDSKLSIKGEDIRRGIIVFLDLRLAEPKFNSQTKNELTNKEVSGTMNKIVYDNITEYFQKNPKITKLLCERVIAFAKTTNNAKERMKNIVNVAQNSMGLKITSDKFKDCDTEDPEITEIYIVEGDSAGGAAMQARFPAFQCVYAVRGKILNTRGISNSKIIGNKELNDFLKIEFGTNDLKKIHEMLQDILKAVNNNDNESYIKLMSNIKSTKIVLMADMDPDGKHIVILFLNFFAEFIPELYELGWVYMARSPFYRVNIRKDTYKYFMDDDEYNSFKTEVIAEKYKVLNKGYDVKKVLSCEEKYREEFNLLKEKNIDSEILSYIIRTDDVEEICETLMECGLDVYEDYLVDGMYNQTYHNFNLKDIIEASYDISDIYDFDMLKLKDLSTGETMEVDIIEGLDLLDKAFKYVRNRIKGLGELDGSELRETTLDPKNRVLIKIASFDLNSENLLFETLFGNNTNLRKDFIKENLSVSI